jgi:hypothetical protein
MNLSNLTYNHTLILLFFWSVTTRDGQTARPARPGPGPVKPGQKPGRVCCASGLNFLSKPGPQRV